MEKIPERNNQIIEHLMLSQANCEALLFDRYSHQNKLSEFVLSMHGDNDVANCNFQISLEKDPTKDGPLNEMCRLVSVDALKSNLSEHDINLIETQESADSTKPRELLIRLKELNPNARFFFRENKIISTRGIAELTFPDNCIYDNNDSTININVGLDEKYPIEVRYMSTVDVFHGKDKDNSRMFYSRQADDPTICNINFINAEIPKTESQINQIDKIFDIINEERRSDGLEEMNIDHRSIHFIEDNAWKSYKFHKVKKSLKPVDYLKISTIKRLWEAHNNNQIAHYDQLGQAIYIQQPKSLEEMVVATNHELAHADGFNSIKQNNSKISPYRLGFETYTGKQNKLPYFKLINEALSQEKGLKRSEKLFKSDQIYADKIDKIDDMINNRTSEPDESLISKFMRNIKKNKRKMLNENDLNCALVIDNDSTQTSINGYLGERNNLKKLTEILAGPDMPEEKIYNMFSSAAFKDGNYLPIARLIEDKFGRGSFRDLGKNSINPNDFDNHIKKLAALKNKMNRTEQPNRNFLHRIVNKFKDKIVL